MITLTTGTKLRRLYENDKDKFKQWFSTLSKKEQAEVVTSWAFQARDKQLRPEGKWNTLLWLCGRGFGKTRALCEDLIANAMSNPGKRIAIVGRTAADVRDIIINGESGILACCTARDIRVNYEPSKRLITFPNGSIAQTYTAEQPDQLRGVQFHDAYCDELAAWQYDTMTWDMLLMTMRLGNDNKIMIATTPQPTQLIRKLTNTEGVHVVRGSTFDNAANLSETYVEVLKREYEGTRIGRQELYGEVLLDTPGALWNWDMIHKAEELPQFKRIVVGVDPAASNNKDSDETGIVVAAYGDYSVDRMISYLIYEE